MALCHTLKSMWRSLPAGIIAMSPWADLTASGSSYTDNYVYDIVVANILPNVLVPLTPVIPKLLRKGGTLVYSGILQTRAAEVEAALAKAGFSVTGKDTLGEWCSLTAVRS